MSKKKKSEAELELEHLVSMRSLMKPEDYAKEYAKASKKVEQSKRGRRSKVKGANYERDIKKVFKEVLDIDLERTPLSGGFAKSKNLSAVKGDLNSLDEGVDFKLHVECKNHRTWSLKEWWRQATDDCPDGKKPIVIMHQGQENKDGRRVQDADDFVFLRLSDFLELVDKSKIIVREEG